MGTMHERKCFSGEVMCEDKEEKSERKWTEEKIVFREG